MEAENYKTTNYKMEGIQKWKWYDSASADYLKFAQEPKILRIITEGTANRFPRY